MSQPLAYHAATRREVAALLPAFSERVLEIGCGTGATLGFLKQEGRCAWTGGVELSPAAAAEATLDRSWCGNIETLDLELPPESLDAVLCLDVLEHLADPWAVVSRLAGLLKPGGVLVASIPNVRHYKVALGLLLDGRWDYQDNGILDRTHLRFFVRSTAIELLSRGGLRVEECQPLLPLKKGKLKWWLHRLSGGRLTDLFATQYLVRGVKP
ncbi:MAG: methyltransferase domain-containing protein [Rhodospirillaceae bacterium]